MSSTFLLMKEVGKILKKLKMKVKITKA